MRKIHLGHVAKSFALRETPVEAIAAARRSREKDAERKLKKGVNISGIHMDEGGREKLVKRARHLERRGIVDEFGYGEV